MKTSSDENDNKNESSTKNENDVKNEQKEIQIRPPKNRQSNSLHRPRNSINRKFNQAKKNQPS